MVELKPGAQVQRNGTGPVLTVLDASESWAKVAWFDDHHKRQAAVVPARTLTPWNPPGQAASG